MRVTADNQDALLDGFYRLESDGHGGPFRWTGPSRAFRIRVAIDRRLDFQGALILLGSESKLNLSNIQCNVDGTDVELEQNSKTYKYSFRLPRRRSPAPTLFEFITRETISPIRFGAVVDDRKLGVIFSELVLTRLP